MKLCTPFSYPNINYYIVIFFISHTDIILYILYSYIKYHLKYIDIELSTKTGISNPALEMNDERGARGSGGAGGTNGGGNDDNDDNEDDEQDDSGNVSTAQVDDTTTSGCFNSGALSPDSEYDLGLAFPDSVTILSMGGDNPILVQRQDDDIDTVVPTEIDIPFLYIYNPPIKFKSIQRKVFIPGSEIQVEIIDNERSFTTHMLNPNLYTIQLTHGPFKWTINKRYKHISALHQQLRVFRASLNFPFPTRAHKERRASFRNNYVTDTATTTSTDNTDKPDNKKKKKGALPRFPNRPESLVPVEAIPFRIKQLEEYLYNLLNIKLYRNYHETVSIYTILFGRFTRELSFFYKYLNKIYICICGWAG